MTTTTDWPCCHCGTPETLPVKDSRALNRVRFYQGEFSGHVVCKSCHESGWDPAAAVCCEFHATPATPF